MQIKQWEDKNLAQFSYGILSDCEKKIILIDPSRNPQPYLDFAKENDAEIIGIIETHSHADFISSHLELHQTTGATIYASRMVEASYPYRAFDEGDTLEYGKIKLSALNTPGHSTDSITILLEHDGKQTAVFTGDTLFVGDCGRPDLRESQGNTESNRRELAKKMYQSLRTKLFNLNDDVILYPGHGAGTLCGKSLSKAVSSTIGEEKKSNWSLQPMSEDEFVTILLTDQPFVPAYFPYNVDLNRKGASPFEESISAVHVGDAINNADDSRRLDKDIWVVDARPARDFKNGHLPLSVNLMEDLKFETWLGSIIKPKEEFYLAGDSNRQLERLIERTAAIGYESKIKEAFVLEHATERQAFINIEQFKKHQEDYTIIDVRNISEVKEGNIFTTSISIPLSDLRDKVNEISTDKPIIVHCAGGYRSAAASSILQSRLKGKAQVFDLGENVKEFQ